MALAPANQPIYYYANDARTKSYTITDGDGAAVDLSGDTLSLTIKKKKGGTAVDTLTTTAGDITISGASNNVVNIAFNNDLEEREYFYDLYNNTDDQTIMYGKLKVTEEVHD